MWIFLVLLRFNRFEAVAVGFGGCIPGLGTCTVPSADRHQGKLDRKSLSSVKLVFALCLSSVTRSARGACRPA
ncbi:hypothetical protein IQ252_01220 [Tychonema sp. LEGE 07203]|nr:hypothetical protein [Tychonema sp. LEGE 07203]